MAKKVKEIDIDDIILTLPQDDKGSIAKCILELIKSGKKWSNNELVSAFSNAPNAFHGKSKAWLPRSIQIGIGKIEPIKGVQLQFRSGSRKKATYKDLDTYLVENNITEEQVQVPIIELFRINCSCGTSFLGREPEHQISCEVCKNSNKVKNKINKNKGDEIQEQINTMFRILKARNLNPVVMGKAKIIFTNKMLLWGLSKEEIDEMFKENGFETTEVAQAVG
jgi:hypothetical protein